MVCIFKCRSEGHLEKEIEVPTIGHKKNHKFLFSLRPWPHQVVDQNAFLDVLHEQEIEACWETRYIFVPYFLIFERSVFLVMPSFLAASLLFPPQSSRELKMAAFSTSSSESPADGAAC